MAVTFVLFILCSPVRSSSVNIVFDFKASLNDVAPLSPISLSVDANKSESMKECSLKQFIQLFIVENNMRN